VLAPLYRHEAVKAEAKAKEEGPQRDPHLVDKSVLVRRRKVQRNAGST
jgi:hypothetical protein